MAYVNWAKAEDEDFMKWAKLEAKLSGESLDSLAFCEMLAAKWATATVLFGKNWKKTLMCGVK